MSQVKMGQISPLCAKGVSQQNFTPTEDITGSEGFVFIHNIHCQVINAVSSSERPRHMAVSVK